MTTPTTAEQIDAVLAEHGLQTLYMLADDADSARLRSVAATIARFEGEQRNLALKLQQVDEELAVDGHYNTVEKAILVRAQANRADAAKETITRLEGELNALRPVVQKNMPVAAQNISEIVTENHVLRTRADAAERRVEAVTGAALAVLDERDRQRTAEGWTDAHDDQHTLGELASAAACYALPIKDKSSGWYAAFWPWAEEWWKPSPNNRRRDLVKAGALILAEIERLDRAALAAASGAKEGR